MDNHISPDEICWKFKFTDNVNDEQIEIFLEEFTFNFVENKGWYCGGSSQMGMYDLSNKATKNDLLTELLKYLNNKKDVVYSIEYIL